MDKAYQNLNNYKKLPLKRSRDGSIITLDDVSKIELGARSTRTLFKVTENRWLGWYLPTICANTIKVAEVLKKILKLASLPPNTSLEVSFDK